MDFHTPDAHNMRADQQVVISKTVSADNLSNIDISVSKDEPRAQSPFQLTEADNYTDFKINKDMNLKDNLLHLT